MKKFLVFLGLMLLLATPLFAQRAAVMEFKAGVGISQADVDGLSGIFTTYFRPAGFTMVERTQIDRVISEQGFQRSCLTEAQMVRIGEILNLSMIVIGDINVVAGEYNVDARVVNVESSVIIATDGESFRGSYRESMKKLAQRLAGQVAIKPGETVKAAPKPKPAASRTTPFVIMGYLKVFPNDLGKFDSVPNSVIRQINSQEQHGYNTWRLPTSEELSLMVANSVVSASDSYMTSDSHRSGIVRLVTDKGTAQEIEESYIKKGRKIENIIWSDRSYNKMNWQSAINYCQTLNEGGLNDWRLPNIDELKTLLKGERTSSCQVSEKNNCLADSCWTCQTCTELCIQLDHKVGCAKCEGFLDGRFSKLGDDGDNGLLWSSSTKSNNSDSAWLVNFIYGGVENVLERTNKSKSYFVRCVRNAE